MSETPTAEGTYVLTEFDRWVESLGLEFKLLPASYTDEYYDFKGNLLAGTVLLRRSGGYDLVGHLNADWGMCGCCSHGANFHGSYAVLPFTELVRVPTGGLA